MFNHFTLEGEVLDIQEHTANSSATKQIITIQIDTSFYDKRNKCEQERITNMILKRYVKDEKIINVGDYIVTNGRINVSFNPETSISYPAFIIEDFVTL